MVSGFSAVKLIVPNVVMIVSSAKVMAAKKTVRFSEYAVTEISRNSKRSESLK